MKFGRNIFLILAFLLLQEQSLFAEYLSDEEFLDKLQQDTFKYFWQETNPSNGLIRDSTSPGSPCSIAAVGFGLVSLCIAEKRGWIKREDAYKRVLTTLKTFYYDLQQERGFYYHFIDMHSGKRVWNSEISSIDTALFLAGALFCGEYFKGTKVDQLAQKLYERVDWKWMLNKNNVLCMGWKPESGFLPYYWDSYNELIILYALAIGSPTHPIPAHTWKAWKRPYGTYDRYTLIYSYTGSLFTYLYSHAWIDFRSFYDGDINYWDNSIRAVKANRQFCINNRVNFSTYSEDCWGLSASLGPAGYRAYGAKPGIALHDGTIAPFAVCGTLPFDRENTLRSIRFMYENYGDKIYGTYGFKDAFNISQDWWAEDYLGIDQGIIMLMIENSRSSMVWKYFMRNNAIQKWVQTCLKIKVSSSLGDQ
ncbi:MAG: glucoamylase family protein [Candidatus Omnitrophota bacterium]